MCVYLSVFNCEYRFYCSFFFFLSLSFSILYTFDRFEANNYNLSHLGFVHIKCDGRHLQIHWAITTMMKISTVKHISCKSKYWMKLVWGRYTVVRWKIEIYLNIYFHFVSFVSFILFFLLLLLFLYFILFVLFRIRRKIIVAREFKKLVYKSRENDKKKK